jgi:hypothetical protein
MSQDIDRITSPEGAREAFKSLMSAYQRVAAPVKIYKSGTFFELAIAIQNLPTPEIDPDGFNDFRHIAKRHCNAMEDAKTKPKFLQARKDLHETLRDLLTIYLRPPR